MRKPALVILLLFISLSSSGLDLARTEMRADLATQTHGVTGRGVLVAILDRGLDCTHPDFRNADGTTRVDSIFNKLPPRKVRSRRF